MLTCTLNAQTRQWFEAERADAQFELEMNMHAESMMDAPRATRLSSPSLELIEPEIMPMSDMDITSCMSAITDLALLNPANHCTVSIRAKTLRSGAEAVLALLAYAHSPPGSQFECPADVTVEGHQNIEPICFLDVRTDFHM